MYHQLRKEKVFITADNLLLDMSGKLHKVAPDYKEVRVCIKCGAYNHSIKMCKAPARCTRCISSLHTIENCTNPRSIKCFNCEEDHIII